MASDHIGEILDQFIERLGPKEDSRICREFEKIHENSERVKFMGNLLKDYGFLGDSAVLRNSKSNAIAEQSRLEGNEFFKNRQFLEALESYNKSLCFAEPGSDLAGLAYSNRSAVFLELKLFKLCLENIEKAKEHIASPENYPRIAKREEKCLEMIRDGAEEISGDPVGCEIFKLSRDPHPDVPFIVDCLKLEKTEEFGRGIVTTKNLYPGEVIAIEEPFSLFLFTEERYKSCANCLKENCLDLHPCSTCTVTMFCSKECEEVGNRKFHQFECPIVDRLDSLRTFQSQLAIRTFFEAFDIFGGNIEQLKALVQENSPDTTVFDFKHPTSRVNLLKAVDAHVTNEKKKALSELMEVAEYAAIFCNLLINYTKLGEILKSDEDRDFLRSYMFKLLQTTSINNINLSDLKMEPEGRLNFRNLGTGTYPFSSLVNNSCAPNVFGEVFNGKHCYVVTRLIGAGQQIFLNYFHTHRSMPREGRRQHLFKGWNFVCRCEACLLDYPLDRDLLADSHFVFKLQYANDHSRLSQLDVEYAKGRVELFRRLLIELFHEYPSQETIMAVRFIKICFGIFSSSEFKLKIIAK